MSTSGSPYGPNSELVERLLSDCRVLGPSGIERIAWGTEQANIDESDPERHALEVIQGNGLQPGWEAAEQALRQVTSGSHSAPAWREEQEGTRRTAEDAARHAGMALVARHRLERDTYRALTKPMSEALPWLLPEEPPDQYRGGAEA